MIKLKIKKGDNVKVITGDDKGKTGNVIKVFPDIWLIVRWDVSLAVYLSLN